MSCQAPFKRGISYECRIPVLVDENNQIRQLIQTSDIMVPNLTLFVLNIHSVSRKNGYPIRISVYIINALYSANVKMRLRNQMLSLSRIFDSFVTDSAKSYFIRSCRTLLIQTSHLKAVTSRIKLGTCESRRLNWVNDNSVEYY